MIAAFLLAAAPVGTAVDAERAFARDAQRIGQWTAFRKYADETAVLFTPQAVWAHDFLKDRKDPPKAVEWWPSESYVSCDGRIAVNTGPAFRDGKHYGQFNTVWVREKEGWHWVYDNGSDPKGTPTLKPAGPKVVRASCRGKAPGAPIIPPVPLTDKQARKTPEDSGQGQSADKTLGWDWKVEKSGEHHFRVYVWNGRGYHEAINLVIPAQ